MSAKEIAELFNEPEPKDNRVIGDDYCDGISLERIAARIKNMAVISSRGNLTDNGIMLANTYAHVIKSFYDFTETINDIQIKDKLKSLIKSNEGMVSDFIAATKK